MERLSVATDYTSEVEEFVESLSQLSFSRKFWFFQPANKKDLDMFLANGFIATNYPELTTEELLVYNNNAMRFGSSEITLYDSPELAPKNIPFQKYVSTSVNRYIQRNNLEVSTEKRDSIKNFLIHFFLDIRSEDHVLIALAVEDQVIIKLAKVKSTGIGEVLMLEGNPYHNQLVKKVEFINFDLSKQLVDAAQSFLLRELNLVEIGKVGRDILQSYQDFFIYDNEATLVINLGVKGDNNAKAFFDFGSILLRWIDGFAHFADVDVHSEDLSISVSLNSRGKVTLKSKIQRTTVIAGLILLVAGGGYEDKEGHSFRTPGVPGIIDAISEFQDREQERNMKQQLFLQYKDSLKIENPEDLIRLWKQFSENKDIKK